MMSSFLPSIPQSKDFQLERLLVSYDLDEKFLWDLIASFDLRKNIHNKPLLQVFCENHLGSSIDTPKTFPIFPSDPSGVWPDPLEKNDQTQSRGSQHDYPKMWLFAILVANSPNPFAWKTTQDWDVLDCLIDLRCAPILDQVLRHPLCPSIDSLNQRLTKYRFSGRAEEPWIIGLTKWQVFSQDSYLKTLRVLLQHGFDPNVLDTQKETPLMVSQNPEITQLLLNYGADAFLKNKKGKVALEKWASGGFYDHYEDRKQYLASNIGILSKHLLPSHKEQLLDWIRPVAEKSIRRSDIFIAPQIESSTGIPFYELSQNKDQHLLDWILLPSTDPNVMSDRRKAKSLMAFVKSLPTLKLLDSYQDKNLLEHILILAASNFDDPSGKYSKRMRDYILIQATKTLEKDPVSSSDIFSILVHRFRQLAPELYTQEHMVALEKFVLDQHTPNASRLYQKPRL